MNLQIDFFMLLLRIAVNFLKLLPFQDKSIFFKRLKIFDSIIVNLIELSLKFYIYVGSIYDIIISI